MKKIVEFTHSRLGVRHALIPVVILALLFGVPLGMAQAYTGYPTFDIVSAVKDVSVTIQTDNLPPNQTFTVRMGKIGTKAIGGVVAGDFDSGEGGTQKLTFDIPDSLKGQAQIAIRIDSPAGYYAYNWFNNSTGTAATATPATPTATPSATRTTTVTSTPGYSGIPTFSIVSVIKDSQVTIKTSNFPADETFTVRMGAYGTKAIDGTVVGTTDSGGGGAFEETYNIPATLKGASRIAIRMDSPNGYYAYNWFVNADSAAAATTPATTPAAPGYSSIPTFLIKAVVKDTSVTITTSNFPANEKFTVRMGAYGTAGVDGTVIGTTESGKGGAFEATYTIPDALKGSTKIAIRLESPNGYYAYNWFWNNTAP